MILFDYSETRKKLEAEAAKIPDTVLDEKVSDVFPDGMKELEDLLTFLPEEKRAAAIQGFIGSMLVS